MASIAPVFKGEELILISAAAADLGSMRMAPSGMSWRLTDLELEAWDKRCAALRWEVLCPSEY